MEPLKTDEPLPPGRAKKPTDIDAMMLAGCGAFLVVSVAVYGLALWPFLSFPNSERLSVLLLSSAIGLLPAYIAGIIGSRLGGVAGACGFVGGALTVSVFLFLRLQQLFTTTGTSVGHDPNYPSWVMFGLPGAWFALALAGAALASPKPKFQGLGAESVGTKKPQKTPRSPVE